MSVTLANPLALWLGLLAAPVVILYLIRVRVPRQQVATGMFWEQVFAAEGSRHSWRRWRRSVSLLAQVVALALVVLAAAEPWWPAPRHSALIIDNSAGMSAADVPPSRLEAAKQTAVKRVAGLRPCDTMAVLTSGGSPVVQCNATADRARLTAAIEAISATAAATRMDEALALAREIVATKRAGRIVIISDGSFAGAKELAANDGVDFVRVGGRTANAAVTCWTARPQTSEPGLWEALAVVRNLSDSSFEGRLAVALDGRTIDTVPVTLAADGRWQKTLEIKTAAGGDLTVKLEPLDAYPADNAAEIVLPAAQPQQPKTGAAATVLSEPVGPIVAQPIDLRAPQDLGIDVEAIVVGRRWPAPWLCLAGMALAILAVEWCLHQRCWTC
jgi:hypothetical protein